MKKTDTKTLISALRILSKDIQSEDGVANAVIAEAADRLEELSQTNDSNIQTINAINNRLEKTRKALENAYEMGAWAACCQLKNTPEFLSDLKDKIIKTRKEIEEILK